MTERNEFLTPFICSFRNTFDPFKKMLFLINGLVVAYTRATKLLFLIFLKWNVGIPIYRQQPQTRDRFHKVRSIRNLLIFGYFIGSLVNF